MDNQEFDVLNLKQETQTNKEKQELDVLDLKKQEKYGRFYEFLVKGFTLGLLKLSIIVGFLLFIIGFIVCVFTIWNGGEKAEIGAALFLYGGSGFISSTILHAIFQAAWIYIERNE